MTNKQEAYKIMTPQEIFDDMDINDQDPVTGLYTSKINPDTGKTTFDEIMELYYDHKEEEAVRRIKELYECEEEIAREAFEIYKREVPGPPTPLMKAEAAAYFGGLYEKNVPKCPTCGSTNIKKISSMSKAVGMLTLGILDADIHRTFYCKNCGYRW